MKLQGQITIGRYASNQAEADGMCYIELTDVASGARILKVELTPAALGFALTGLSHQACTVNLYESTVIGKQREVKHVDIEFPDEHITGDDIRAAAAPYETDGWKCAFGNSQIRFERKGGVRVVSVPFIRFVEDSQEVE